MLIASLNKKDESRSRSRSRSGGKRTKVDEGGQGESSVDRILRRK